MPPQNRRHKEESSDQWQAVDSVCLDNVTNDRAIASNPEFEPFAQRSYQNPGSGRTGYTICLTVLFLMVLPEPFRD